MMLSLSFRACMMLLSSQRQKYNQDKAQGEKIKQSQMCKSHFWIQRIKHLNLQDQEIIPNIAEKDTHQDTQDSTPIRVKKKEKLQRVLKKYAKTT